MGYAVGIMSGTSLDGIDVALVDINGVDEETTVRLIDFKTVTMSERLKNRIKEQLIPELSSVDKLCSLNFELSVEFADAVLQICKANRINSYDLKFVASHGQTLFHQPFSTNDLVASTLQLGEPAILAEKLKTTIISNFRSRDMAVGGQGAPLVPYSEYLLYRKKDTTVFLQNIGGIGNVTILLANCHLDDVVAFDTGPGNMIIDGLCQYFYHKNYDDNGYYSSQGQINSEVLAELKEHPYLKLPFPKTTGREIFGQQYVDYLVKKYNNVSANDLIATVTYFTAYCIAYHIQKIDYNGKAELIIGGGGSYNTTLVNFIKQLLVNVDVKIQEEVGLSSEAKEAIAFAVLGNQTLHYKCSNVPSATGAHKAVMLGSVTYY